MRLAEPGSPVPAPTEATAPPPRPEQSQRPSWAATWPPAHSYLGEALALSASEMLSVGLLHTCKWRVCGLESLINQVPLMGILREAIMRLRNSLTAALLAFGCLQAQYTPAPTTDGGNAAYRMGLELAGQGEVKRAIQAYRAAAQAGNETAKGLLITYFRNGTLAKYGELTDYERALTTPTAPASAPLTPTGASRSVGTTTHLDSNRWPWLKSVFDSAGLQRLSTGELDALNSHISSLLQRAMAMANKTQPPASLAAPSIPSGEAFKSQIDGDFEGWDGDTVFELTNGQIWMQDEYAYAYHYSFMPKVLIYKGRSGEWRMRVEDMTETIRVRRLR